MTPSMLYPSTTHGTCVNFPLCPFTPPIKCKKDYQEDIRWGEGEGIFGSVARNRAHVESNVDILIALKEYERSGEPTELRESELTFRLLVALVI